MRFHAMLVFNHRPQSVQCSHRVRLSSLLELIELVSSSCLLVLSIFNNSFLSPSLSFISSNPKRNAFCHDCSNNTCFPLPFHVECACVCVCVVRGSGIRIANNRDMLFHRVYEIRFDCVLYSIQSASNKNFVSRVRRRVCGMWMEWREKCVVFIVVDLRNIVSSLIWMRYYDRAFWSFLAILWNHRTMNDDMGRYGEIGWPQPIWRFN